MIFSYMQHSQSHMIFYRELIFLSWGGRILHKVEPLVMVLLSAHLASLSPHYSVGLTSLIMNLLYRHLK